MLNEKGNITASLSLQVPFYDVDSMGVVWHGNYVKYFEKARCVLLDKIDYNYEVMEKSGYIWPVVDLRVKYIKPLRFNQRIVIEVELQEWESRLKLGYIIRDEISGEKVSSGYSIQVAVDNTMEEMQYVLPEAFQKKIQDIIN